MEKFKVDLLKNGSTAKQYAERVTGLLGPSLIETTDTSDLNDDCKFVKTCIISGADEVVGKIPQEEKHGLMRNVKRSQGSKMRYIGKFSRDEKGPERKSMGTYEELKKEHTNGRSGHSIMTK
jgi:hypothetical protein